ncbi:hypothetical protein PGTUg99_006999 [Puccinia graminis f. sp. tritici]|uniref:Uncharacterized protein n=1 Tax=Puccinia graminis f. sp. tritici TaxID=56615 RepID=A0A5B0PB20_PUCGR|nr:hypothetical protein PGTUg99_006999 [Puccinia graminis f. sp. tritici]
MEDAVPQPCTFPQADLTLGRLLRQRAKPRRAKCPGRRGKELSVRRSRNPTSSSFFGTSHPPYLTQQLLDTLSRGVGLAFCLTPFWGVFLLRGSASATPGNLSCVFTPRPASPADPRGGTH